MHPEYTPRDISRFWSRVDRSADCWLWIGQPSKRYVRFRTWHINGQDIYIDAHVASYEINIGPIPEGLFVCHSCDTPRCVRPDHLFLATPAGNTADMIAKGRHAHGDRHWSRANPDKTKKGNEHWSRKNAERVRRGAKHHRAMLSEEKVRIIRQLYRPYIITAPMLAKQLGISVPAVNGVIHGRSWSYVEMER